MVRYAKFLLLALLLLVVVLTSCAPAATPAPEATPTEAPAPPEATPAEVPPTPTPEEAGPKEGGTLVISLGTDVPIFDSIYASGIPNLGIIHLVTEGLTRIDPLGGDPKVLPVLAESWEQSADGETWTFKLRQGVMFHDGTPFNAEAVRFNIMDRMLNPDAKALAASAFNMIESVEVVDEYTVNMITDGPFAGLPAQLAYSPMAMNSPTQVQKLGNEDYHTAPMGTGPFKFMHHIKGQEVLVEANEDYWGGAPYLDAIAMRPIPETPARLMALEAGESHVIYHVPPRDAQRYIDDPSLGIDVLTPPQQRTIFVGMNNKWGPFEDVRVRQALNYAVDQQAIIDNILLELTQPMDSPLPPASACYQSTKNYAYDPDKARQLLAEAGYGDGFKATLHYGAGRFLLDSEVVEAVQSYLADVGVEVEVIQLEWAAFQATWKKPLEETEIQLFFVGWGNPTVDPDLGTYTYVEASWPPGLNAMFYSNPDLEQLIAAQRAATDPVARCEIVNEIQEIIMEDTPQIFLYYEPQVHAKRQEAHDVTISVTEQIDQMHKAWLDTE